MKKVTVIYFSNTGNTEAMAEAVRDGASSENSTVALMTFDSASLEDVKDADAIAFGCPACGAEELDDTEVIPFIESVKDALNGKEVALFGSSGWGDGAYMEDWVDMMNAYNVKLVGDGLTLLETPDSDGIEECKQLGSKLQ